MKTYGADYGRLYGIYDCLCNHVFFNAFYARCGDNREYLKNELFIKM